MKMICQDLSLAKNVRESRARLRLSTSARLKLRET